MRYSTDCPRCGTERTGAGYCHKCKRYMINGKPNKEKENRDCYERMFTHKNIRLQEGFETMGASDNN